MAPNFLALRKPSLTQMSSEVVFRRVLGFFLEQNSAHSLDNSRGKFFVISTYLNNGIGNCENVSRTNAITDK